MAELAVDELLDDKYRILRLVGQGAWATVYEGINVRIQRRVAIKVLNIELAGRPELLARFTREAEAATQIESPFVVTMFDAGRLLDGRPYIVMEFLEGEDLAQRLARVGALPAEQAVSYAIHLLSGLADAHATGVLHRDIKPDNLVIVKSRTGGEEILKLVDFGISKPNVTRPGELVMTKTDIVLGSPVYMSPEQARGTRHMDHRSDLYSVGVVLYEAVTKELPHEADNFNELMFKVALEDAPDARTKKPDLDEALAIIIQKALSREPDKRFQSAIDFRDVLIEWADKRGTQPTSPFVTTSKIRIRSAESSSRFEVEDDRSGVGVRPSSSPVPPPSPAAVTTSPVLLPSSISPSAVTPPPALAPGYPTPLPSPPIGSSPPVGSSPPLGSSPPTGPSPPLGSSPPRSSPPPVMIQPSRSTTPLLLGGVTLLLLGAGVAFLALRVLPMSRPPPPTDPTVVLTTSPAPPSASETATPIVPTPPSAPVTAPTPSASSSTLPAAAAAATTGRATTPSPAFPPPPFVPRTTASTTTPKPSGKPSSSPPPVVTNTPPATSGSATVVEGRSVRTTY